MFFPHHLTETVSIDQAAQISLTPFEYENQIGSNNSHCVIEQDEADKDSNIVTFLRIFKVILRNLWNTLLATNNSLHKNSGDRSK
jgi:hypothetical protein